MDEYWITVGSVRVRVRVRLTNGSASKCGIGKLPPSGYRMFKLLFYTVLVMEWLCEWYHMIWKQHTWFTLLPHLILLCIVKDLGGNYYSWFSHDSCVMKKRTKPSSNSFLWLTLTFPTLNRISKSHAQLAAGLSGIFHHANVWVEVLVKGWVDV